MSNNIYVPALITSILPAVELLNTYVNQEVKYAIGENPDKVSIYFSEDHFPIDLVNTGAPGIDDWSGDPSVLEALREVEAQGYKVEMYTREVGDETGFDASHQDFKLVIAPVESAIKQTGS